MDSLAYATRNYPIGQILYTTTRLDRRDAASLMALSLACRRYRDTASLWRWCGHYGPLINILFIILFFPSVRMTDRTEVRKNI